MLFITQMEPIEGKDIQAIKKFKNPNIPQGIKILNFYGLFGKPDAMIIFEADDEKAASDFVIQFSESAKIYTSLAFSIDKLKWTR